MQPLTVSLIQSSLFWEDKEANLNMFASKIAQIPKSAQVVLLPEMFNTGFSMHPERFAEKVDGITYNWLKKQAIQYRKIIAGSFMVEENGKFYNRLVWMQPNGVHYHYDKRHLFAYGGEDQHFSAGNNKVIVQVNGWRICLMVCYDLRFPVWARQKPAQLNEQNEQYDALLYVANWPERRSHAWKSLVVARAIENQCFVLAVNRVGEDGNQIYYSGDSMIVDPLGEVLWHQSYDEAVFTFTLQPEVLIDTRKQFPFQNDADNFLLL